MSKFKAGIWGQFGNGGPIADGQAVRTTIITEELELRYGKENIKRVNTNNWKKHSISFFFKSVALLSKCDNIIVFPADNGFKTIVPLYYFFNKLYKKNLYYVVIGGFLPNLLAKQPKYIKQLKSFKAMFVQTENIKADLEKLGLDNIRYITNLKRIKAVSPEEIILNNDENIKVCTFSRVTENKGVLDAIEAVRISNGILGGKKITLEVYGMLPDSFKDRFNEELSKSSDFVTYRGIAPYDKTSDILKDYFALLFPTYFHGEGFPGCFIDAFHAGIPVIATDWLYNKDLIKDGENGLLVPVKNPKALSDAILKLYNDRSLRKELALGSLSKVPEYLPEKVLSDFFNCLEGKA